MVVAAESRMSVEHREFIPGRGLSADAVAEWTPMLKKPNPVYMRQVDEPFTVHTNEGPLTAKPGDFVAHDPISGHFWPVAASYVEQHYDPATTS